MIRRLLTGLAALLLLAVGLLGLPVFLTGAYRALDTQMPDLADLPSVLLAPGDGGLFLLLLFAVGWLCWAVFTAAFAAEVIARARGMRTPHLGAFFPQATMARAVSSVALMLTLTPVAAHALPTGLAPAAAPTTTTSQPATPPTTAADQDQRETEQVQHEAEQGDSDYVVERGDTLWDIADERLDDPTRYPEIVAASQDITQPDGQHLSDPDLILPGWTLHVPTAQDEASGAQAPAPTPAGEDETAAAGRVDLPTTPLSAPAAPDRAPAGGGPTGAAAAAVGSVAPALPVTPMSAAAREPVDAPAGSGYREAVYDDEGRFAPTHGVLGLPNWITAPLTPTRPADAPELVAAAQRHLAATHPGPGSPAGP
jgi:hypothetical protein